VIAIDGVKVHRRVFAPIHVNDDAEESGYFGHYATFLMGVAFATVGTVPQ
jgi:hypothetical protein